jgi:cytochrome c-type biogenesis protein CcmF
MIPEMGLFFLLAACVFSLLLVIVPTWGVIRKDMVLQQTATAYVWGQLLCVILSYVCLTISFLRNDFSVVYVLSNSSTALPWFYKWCAVWGGHEGSMLLWVLILSIWMALVSQFSAVLDAVLRVRVLVVLGFVSFGFLLFLLLTSNPFLRQFVDLTVSGRDLNPLLQDPGFLFHPPMLYMGYVGFSVAFAFAIAALWQGGADARGLRWARTWTLAAWCCLTLGITLGSWWAYRELGWGGFWFWDPVENASFMPWLAGTALIHSLMITEKRQHFYGWTLLLAIFAFSLSLIGTFLVRSGVLTSVHAFAVDPERGLFILVFLSVVIGGSLLLFLSQSRQWISKVSPALISRESALLLSNVFLMVATLTVLLGTVYPLLIDGLHLGKLSVGAPYFNAVFIPLFLPVLGLMGIGVHLKWGANVLKPTLYMLRFVVLSSVVGPLVLLFLYHATFNLSVFCGLLMAFWVILSTFLLWVLRIRARRSWKIGQGFTGMLLAHLGIAVTVIGITLSTQYGVEDDRLMHPGQRVLFVGYQVEWLRALPLQGPNYHGMQAAFKITNANGKVALIYPEKRIYEIGQMPMTDAAIDASVFRDIYIALGEPVDDRTFGVRLYYKPFVRWIWGGGLLMLMGGLLAFISKRDLLLRSTPSSILV